MRGSGACNGSTSVWVNRLVGVTSLLFFCEFQGVNQVFKQLPLPSQLFHCLQRTFFFPKKINYFYFIYVYGWFAYMDMYCITCVFGASRGQKKGLRTPGVQVIDMWLLEMEPRSSGKVGRALNHGAYCTAP